MKPQKAVAMVTCSRILMTTPVAVRGSQPAYGCEGGYVGVLAEGQVSKSDPDRRPWSWKGKQIPLFTALRAVTSFERQEVSMSYGALSAGQPLFLANPLLGRGRRESSG